jgi:alpha-mannosidase
MKVRSFREVVGEFTLMAPADAAAFAGVTAPELPPVRVIESGPVRTVVEALMACGRSALALRYKIPAVGAELEVEAQVAWFERDRMLKLALPTPFKSGEVRMQTAYGTDVVRRLEEEAVGHRWLAVVSDDGQRALTLVNDSTYGFDVAEGEVRLSLLRAPAYAGHPVDDVTPIVRQDRFEPREDQGEHTFRFWMNAGPSAARLQSIDREARVRTDGLMALCAFPSGEGRAPCPGLLLDDPVVRLCAMKVSEDGRAVIVRLFEPTGEARATRVSLPALDLHFSVALRPFEIRTIGIDLETKAITDRDLIERVEVRR